MTVSPLADAQVTIGYVLAGHDSYDVSNAPAFEGAFSINPYLMAQAEARQPFEVAQAHGEGDGHAASSSSGHDEHAEDGHEEHAGDGHDEHGGGHGEHHDEGYRMPGEFPNVYTLFTSYGHDHAHHHATGFFQPNPNWYVNPLFTLFTAGVFLIAILKMIGRPSVQKPSKPQVAVELLFGGLMSFFGDIVGKENARKYVPYVATLWLFILINKLSGLVPGLKSPWAHFESVFALGVVTFFWVNGNAIAAGGIGHFIWHLCGSPTNIVGWALAPLMIFLETIGTLIKPVSLSLRLFGNTFGEDKLLASFLGLGMIVVSILFGVKAPMVGLPLHFPFMFLGVLASFIQATVFAMLAAVYIAMLLPHHDHEHEHEEEHEAAMHHGEAVAEPPPVA